MLNVNDIYYHYTYLRFLLDPIESYDDIPQLSLYCSYVSAVLLGVILIWLLLLLLILPSKGLLDYILESWEIFY